MTETLEAPTLTPGPETTRMLAALAYTAGQALHRRARIAGDDRGRVGQLRPDRTDPPVRTLFDVEAAGFDHSQAERRHTRGADGTVSVAVGPLADSGWALIAQAETGAGDRCVDEHTARAAAEEVLARGQNGVSRLHQVGEMAAARAAQAARGELEPDEQLWARAARALHEAWPGHARVVEPVVHGTSGQHGVDPTFAVLAARLEQLEGRGYPMVDVLRAVDPDRVGREVGRRAAAGAVDDEITRSLTGLAVVNLGGRIRPAGPSTQRARPARAAGVDDADIAPLLAAALPAETVAKIRGARDYEALVEDLRGRVGRGEDVAALLSGLRARNIDRAHDPAAYLKACMRRAAERVVVDGDVVETTAQETTARETAQASGLGETGEGPGPSAGARRGAAVPDGEIPPLLAAALPAETVAKVRGARGYEALVADLRGRVGRGEDVTGLLSGLRSASIDRAHDPAAYLAASVRRAAVPVIIDGTLGEAAAAAAMHRAPGGTAQRDRGNTARHHGRGQRHPRGRPRTRRRGRP